MRKKLATLLITSSLLINSCIKSRSSQDVLVDSMVASKETQTFVVGSNSNKESPIPQKVFLTVEERINWLNSQRVKSALEDFDKFKQLLPEIAEFIGRVLQDCKTDECIKNLIGAVGSIANNTPTRHRPHFGILEPFNAKILYYQMLSDKNASPDKKLGVLALMLLSSDIATNILRGDLPDVLSSTLSQKPAKKPNRPKGEVEVQLEFIAEENPELQKPIEFLITTIKGDNQLLGLEEIPINQLKGLLNVFVESNKKKDRAP
jgi:predicted fused transcriptional regulator/phosphomethylpyrimidine kinase